MSGLSSRLIISPNTFKQSYPAVSSSIILYANPNQEFESLFHHAKNL